VISTYTLDSRNALLCMKDSLMNTVKGGKNLCVVVALRAIDERTTQKTYIARKYSKTSSVDVTAVVEAMFLL